MIRSTRPDAAERAPFAVRLVTCMITIHTFPTGLARRPAGAGPLAGRWRSPARRVGPDTPPLFLAHAMDDDAVPVDNSLLMTAAMREAKRPVEAHLFQGRHAFGIGGRAGAASSGRTWLWLARLSPSAGDS